MDKTEQWKCKRRQEKSKNGKEQIKQTNKKYHCVDHIKCKWSKHCN